jgi:FMN phosphatase YigB (HAD superfamily)
LSGRKALLFDLDGTLLPMDREEFVRAYLPGISAVAAKLGDPRTIANCILQGSFAMLRSTDPERTLEQVFWDSFEQTSGISRAASEPVFDRFYRSAAFDELREITPAEPLVLDILAAAHATGMRVILATSPLFPRVATEKRVWWAGLKSEDFELITTYESFHAAKPHREYYEELLGLLGLSGPDCIMVGNDAREDLPAPNALGMETFLLLNHAIIPEGYEYRCDHQGDYGALLEFIRTLLPPSAEGTSL